MAQKKETTLSFLFTPYQWVKIIINLKINVQSSFAHSYVFSNLYDFFPPWERGIFESSLFSRQCSEGVGINLVRSDRVVRLSCLLLGLWLTLNRWILCVMQEIWSRKDSLMKQWVLIGCCLDQTDLLIILILSCHVFLCLSFSIDQLL